ncbi:DUF559 domain-containing protein [Blastococcus sp. HT6-30]|uniref:DUF559 domain-containing protein n=1 Tax=Blastococcus sp. HT6-30 TaxID=3144843 RepID=UPI003218F76C
MPPPRRPDRLVDRVFRGADAIAAGLLTKDALRSSAWRRLYRGVYADASLESDFSLQVTGALLLVPAPAVFSGRTAAYLLGAQELVDRGTPVEVTVPPDVRFGPVAGLRIRRMPLPEADVLLHRGRRVTSGLRTALDIARAEALVDAVVALDVLVGRAIVGLGELRAAAAELGSVRGARRAQRAVAMACPFAESQPESRLRVLLSLAGMAPVPQFSVRDGRGDFVARVDLAFPDQRVAVEYDGAWHAAPGQFARDRRRLNRLVAAGWTVIHVTAADMRDPDGLVARVRAALEPPRTAK